MSERAPAPAKVDLKKTLGGYVAPRGRFETLTVPPRQYLMIDGHGDPNGSAYADALAVLYPVAYTLKFASKAMRGRDYVVPPLEALWWADDMRFFTSSRDATQWHWTAMNLVPDWLTADDVAAAVSRVAEKGASRPLGALRLETLDEGLCVQTLHVGPYTDEGPVLERMHSTHIPSLGSTMTGRHHEIYLNDARRTAPERLRTILRQPISAQEVDTGLPAGTPT